MDIVKFLLDINYGNYASQDASNIKICVLGGFLTSDIGYHSASFKEWGLRNKWKNDETNGNCTFLKKEGNYILLSDLYSEEAIPTVLKITKEQYKQILTDWEEKVCKLKPKEVTITYDNNKFVVETKN